MIKIYLDASVIIAAMISPSGGSAQVMKLAKLGAVVAVTSQTVIEEIEKHSLKIKKSRQQIGDFIMNNQIIVRGKVIVSETGQLQGLIDPKDAHLIAGARLTECQYLLTLDKKHLLQEGIKEKFQPLKILTPKELLESLV